MSRFMMGLILLTVTTIANADITLLAAASLHNALSDISKLYETKTAIKIKTSFASSSILAKQIENGIPADLFISADLKWMDYLASKGKIDNNSRHDLLANRLVLIAPKGHEFNFKLSTAHSLATAFDGKLCTGEPETVPVGKYAKEALEKLALWHSIKARIVGTEDVRSALAFVERGECAAGIVYNSDAKNNTKVTIIDSFPEESHTPIIYPIALIKQSESAQAFLHYLTQSEATAIFNQYGFNAL